jgi:hypothetical protein
MFSQVLVCRQWNTENYSEGYLYLVLVKKQVKRQVKIQDKIQTKKEDRWSLEGRVWDAGMNIRQ